MVLFESHFDRFRPHLKEDAWRERPEPGSGVLFDLGPHLIDQAMVLFGEPAAISADLRIEREGASVDDAFDVVFYYPNSRALLRAGMMVSYADAAIRRPRHSRGIPEIRPRSPGTRAEAR